MVFDTLGGRVSQGVRGVALSGTTAANRRQVGSPGTPIGTPTSGTPGTAGTPHRTPIRGTTSRLPWARAWNSLRVRTRFKVIDVILNCVLFTPLVVLFQVSASGLQDILFLNHVPGPVGTAILLALGMGIEFIGSCCQQSCAMYVSDRDPGDVKYVTITRIYHYAMAFANVCHYRGLSDIYYWLLGYSAGSALQAISTTVLLLWGAKCARNVLGPPLGVGVDSSLGNFFETSTYFKTQTSTHRRVTYMLDTAATVVGVTSLCNLHWIAVWAGFDAILFPDNLTFSVIASWAIGYFIVTLAFCLESRAQQGSRRMERSGPGWKVLFEDSFLIGANVGVILIWRGHWIFFEGLGFHFPIFHNGFDITPVYSNLAAFVMLCLCYASATAVGKGCDIDGQCEDGQGIAFGVDYFADFFSEELEQEEEEEREAARAAAAQGKVNATTHAQSVDRNYNVPTRPKDAINKAGIRGNFQNGPNKEKVA